MVQIPTAYPAVQEPAIATFNFTDIAEGTGVFLFKGFTDINDTTIGYNLGGADFYSYSTATGVTLADDNNFTKQIDIDFDLSPLNLPRTIKGDVVINLSFATAPGGDGGSTDTSLVYVIAKLRKWDGSTETELGSAQTQTLTGNSFLTQVAKTTLVKFNVSRTHFRKGETIRLTLEGWGKVAVGTRPSGSHSTMTISHDPKDRNIIDTGTVDADASKLDLYIPFELGL